MTITMTETDTALTALSARPCLLLLGHAGVDWPRLQQEIGNALQAPVIPTSFEGLQGILNCHRHCEGALLGQHRDKPRTAENIDHPWFGAALIQPDLFLSLLQKALGLALDSGNSAAPTLRRAEAMFWSEAEARAQLDRLLDAAPNLHIVAVHDSDDAAVARFVRRTNWKSEAAANTIRKTEESLSAVQRGRPERIGLFDMAATDAALSRLQDTLATWDDLS